MGEADINHLIEGVWRSSPMLLAGLVLLVAALLPWPKGKKE